MSHWTTKLVGIRAPGAELDWLGPDADQVRSALGDGAVAWAINVGQRIATKITQELPPLGDTAPHFNALRRLENQSPLRRADRYHPGSRTRNRCRRPGSLR
jgi:hypothetical protein